MITHSRVVVAAANSSPESKEKAHLVCTGENDHKTIQFALDSLEVTGSLELLAGDYRIEETIIIRSGTTWVRAGKACEDDD